MATKHTNNTNNGGNGTAEISIFALNIKGGEAVVQSAIHQFAKAGFSVALPQTPKPPPVSLPAPSGASADAKAIAQTALPFEDVAQVEETTPEPPATATPRPRRTFSPVELLVELNVNDAPVPFCDFVKGRSVDGFNERGLVAATWVRDHRQVKQFTVQHIATCFKAMTLEDAGRSRLFVAQHEEGQLRKARGRGPV